MSLIDRLEQLVLQHNGLRAAARAVGIDAAYFLRLLHGEKANPSAATLRKLNLVKEIAVTYRRRSRRP